MTLVALGLLGGAVAKSAQLPLHTWLPDAMEGPTPVSALIHAATMVTAGVYLIARTHPIFEASDGILELAGILGAVTLVVAGLIALVQTDIKRVIAYSTMSQIGYMFVGVGVGAYATAMFHLMTHAFFKALLFLAAGHRDPPPRRRAGHPQDGRAQGRDAADDRRVPRRFAGARRDPAPLRLLLEGLDPRRSVGARRLRLRTVRGGARRRLPDRDLRVPALLRRLRRRAVRLRPRARRRSRTRRGAADDDSARRDPGRAGRGRRPAPGRRRLASLQRLPRPGRRADRRAVRDGRLGHERGGGPDRGRRRSPSPGRSTAPAPARSRDRPGSSGRSSTSSGSTSSTTRCSTDRPSGSSRLRAAGSRSP